MECQRRAHGEEAAGLAGLLEQLDHLRQRRIGQPVAVVGEEHLLVLDVLAHGQQALADVAPDAGVDQRHPPVGQLLAEDLHLAARIRDDAVRIGLLPPIEEEFLDGVGLVAEAQHEIAVPVLAVVLHHVPQDRLLADRDHGLGDVLAIVADARAETAAEQHDLHDAALTSADRVGLLGPA